MPEIGLGVRLTACFSTPRRQGFYGFEPQRHQDHQGFYCFYHEEHKDHEGFYWFASEFASLMTTEFTEITEDYYGNKQ